MTINLNTNLKMLLRNNNLTATQLARATKVPVQTIHNWIHGQEPRSFKQIKKIADYFELTVDELVYSPAGKAFRVGPIKEFIEEINAGVFEVVLRKVRDNK